MKRVLVVVPFENLYPPMNGGMLRAMNLLHQFSRHFELTAIVQQDGASFRRCLTEFPALKNAAIISAKSFPYKKDIFSLMPARIGQALRFRYWNRSVKGPTSQGFLTFYPILREVLKKQPFDYIIFEDIVLVRLSRLIRRHQKNACIIYDAYNVNSRLALAEVTDDIATRINYEQTLYEESNLTRHVDRIFTCSENDLSQLVEMNGGKLKGMVVPNGTGITEEPGGNEQVVETDDILFCGSLDYFPNREGLLWFCKEVLPLLVEKKPSVRLMVVGKGDPGDELSAALKHDHIKFYGRVERVSDYYKKTLVAVVPLLSGSGTRLKLLEAMANRVAVVSTTVGAEGIDYTDGKNISIADEGPAFAQAIVELLNKKDQALTMAKEAFSFVREQYDWNVIGDRLSEQLT